MQNLAIQDRALYDSFVELTRFLLPIEVDFRHVSQLKAGFISKDHGALAYLPINTFKETIKGVFKHFRQVDEIITRISECVKSEITKNGELTILADSSKLSAMIEFMKYYPQVV